MSRDSHVRSPLIRFLDSFFQEQNIKWMLGVGTLILLGSSLMLVTTHWHDYTPVWKYLILMAYTAAIFVAGEFSYHRLLLRRTGTGLMALTVLLLPISFLALRWLHAGAALTLSGLLQQAGLVGLLVANAAFCAFAAHRIFTHFLRRSQPTFIASYVLLCLAGSLVPALPTSWAPAIAVVLWGVFCAGTVKVNRHVFWLTEERRLPRIFGFFPIALLGGQFFALFILSLAPHVPLDWIGFGLLLVAVPVLLTADTVARVSQQRTGDLVRPYPASIVGPIFIALALCAAGVILAATGWPSPYALTPTALLAAVLLGATARRTQHRGFVWGMLFAMALAYNFSPIFFRETARALVAEGAAAVRESRLPLAFYGLTYLPLLAVLTGAARRLQGRGEVLFARPIRHFIVGLECLLLAVALTHAKAIFPVGAALTLMFAVQTLAFRNRTLIPLGIVAWVAAAFGLAGFVTGVLGLSLPAEFQFVALGGAAGLLLAPGAWIDRRSASLAPGAIEAPDRVPFCQFASLGLTMALAGGWIAWTLAFSQVIPWMSGALLAFLLFAHALRWLQPGLGEVSLLFAGASSAVCAGLAGVSASAIVEAAILGAACLWVSSYILARAPRTRISRAFGMPSLHVGLAGVGLGLGLYSLPQFVLATVRPGVPVAWLCGLIGIAWSFDAARRIGHPVFAYLGCAAILAAASALVSGVLGPAVAHAWLPAVWAAVASAMIVALHGLRSAFQDGTLRRSMERPIVHSAVAVLTGVAVGSIIGLTPAWRVAGFTAVAGLFTAAVLLRRRMLGTLAAILVNWQALAAVVQIGTSNGSTLLDVSRAEFTAAALFIAVAAAASRMLWHVLAQPRKGTERDLVELHAVQMGLVAFIGLGVSFLFLPTGLTLWQVIAGVGAFGLLAACEFRSASRDSSEQRVWWAEAIAGAGVVFLAFFGVIPVAHTSTMFGALAAAVLVWGAGRWAERTPPTAILARPLALTGLALPLLAVAIGVFRHFNVPDPAWPGLNSLALLFVAAFYFWRGLESARRLPLLVLSAVFLNVSLALLWQDLRWSDPQFFMIPLGVSILALVQLLKSEIPSRLHDPLHYVGALTILVSPTFEIVGGNWIPLFTLMIASVAVTLVAIGLRVRALVYTGTAFLAADLIAMVVRGTLDRPNVLWIAGVVLGAAVLALAAYCERHRERVLQRLRLLAAELQTWN